MTTTAAVSSGGGVIDNDDTNFRHNLRNSIVFYVFWKRFVFDNVSFRIQFYCSHAFHPKNVTKMAFVIYSHSHTHTANRATHSFASIKMESFPKPTRLFVLPLFRAESLLFTAISQSISFMPCVCIRLCLYDRGSRHLFSISMTMTAQMTVTIHYNCNKFIHTHPYTYFIWRRRKKMFPVLPSSSPLSLSVPSSSFSPLKQTKWYLFCCSTIHTA